jgi:hypothetical protein
LPAGTQYADLVVEVAPGRLAQVEFVTKVEPDIGLRMHEYRSRLMRREPDCRLEQHVLVLGQGTVPEQFGDDQHWFRLNVAYLRDRDPAELLSSPSLAPLAVLARADSPQTRASTMQAALTVIQRREPDRTRRERLAEMTLALARIYLEGRTIEEAEKEVGVSFDLSELVAEHRRASAELRAYMARVGPEQIGRETLLGPLLRKRFGFDDRIPDLVEKLATEPPEVCVQRVMDAKTLDDLIARSS